MASETKKQLEIINQQIKELIGIYKDAVSASNISENEFWIWYALIIMDDEYSQQDICDLWSLSKQTINTIISNMIKKNYVTLEVVPGTRNRKIIRLTDVGRTYGEHIVLPVSQAEQRALERLSLKERAACTAALGKYIRILKEELYASDKQ